MGNWKKHEGTGPKGGKKKTVQKVKEAYRASTGTTTADAGVAARRALAIQRGGVKAAEGIRDRAVKQRDESRVEVAEANSCCKMSLISCPRRKANSTWSRTSGTSQMQPWPKPESSYTHRSNFPAS